MEFRDPNNYIFQFHYNREERLRQKLNNKKEVKKKFSFLSLNWSSSIRIFLNFVFTILIVVLVRLFLIPIVLGTNETYQIKTKEIIFKDEIIIEVSLKSLSNHPNSFSVWAENDNGKSQIWQGSLEKKGEKSLYFILSSSSEKFYILWIKQNNNTPISRKIKF